MALKGNRAERAAKVRKKINAIVGPRGFFSIGPGYGYLNRAPDRVRCEGCAVGAACVALTDEREPRSRYSIFFRLEGHELITHSDLAQLEMGYEKWQHAHVIAHNRPPREIAAIYSHPFYKIGKELRNRYWK